MSNHSMTSRSPSLLHSIQEIEKTLNNNYRSQESAHADSASDCINALQTHVSHTKSALQTMQSMEASLQNSRLKIHNLIQDLAHHLKDVMSQNMIPSIADQLHNHMESLKNNMLLTPQDEPPCAYITLSNTGYIEGYTDTLFRVFPHLERDMTASQSYHFTDIIHKNAKRHIYDVVLHTIDESYMTRVRDDLSQHQAEWVEYLENGNIVEYHLTTLSNQHKIMTVTLKENALHHQTSLHRMAYIDSLTGFSNTAHIKQCVEHMLSPKEHRIPFVVLHLSVQACDGVQNSDWLIQQVAKRLASCIRQGDIVGHSIGGAFYIVLKNLAHPDSIRSAIERILQHVHTPYARGSDTVFVHLTCGAACFPGNGESADDLMEKADLCRTTVERNGIDPNKLNYR